MTNLERVAWLKLQKEKIDEQKKEMDREKAKARSKGRAPRRR